ncbi:S8 family serine peptidase [Streptomyces sp. Tu 4128]|uniref:S8 family serine peptidase n=1 Tax=Streptomyces sp. Tu 4128 TaxID=1120314 RepID=UPI000F02D4DD|nr:S8 family serine peptidase [Streptomyces sp. Tu 4128]
MTSIDDKHAGLLASGLNLGAPVGPEIVLYDGGSMRPFEFGRIFFHPRIGEAFELHGLILATYLELGAEYSGLGHPVTDEIDDAAAMSGRRNVFEQGSLRFDPAVGVTHEAFERELVPSVTVKVVDGTFVPLGPGGALTLTDFANATVGPGFEPVIAVIGSLLPGLRLRRVFDTHTGDEIQVMIDEARSADPDYSAPDFNNFLAIDCPPGFDTDGLAAALSQLAGTVEYAYTTPLASDPVVGTSNPLFSRQGYLRPALDGIGVQAAWAKGADGSGLQFIDVEQGWFLGGHQDLPTGIQLLGGHNIAASFPHGAAVLGEVVGADNTVGICGIAPVASTRVMSYNQSNPPFNSFQSRQELAHAVMVAQAQLRFGDVLLLEAQLAATIGGVKHLVPAETDPAVFAAVRLATARGVSVVEAAANSGAPLDQFVGPQGRHSLDRQSPDFQDSGAIMVGGGSSALPHGRLAAPNPTTNGRVSGFGTRVDCYSWVENVVTCGNPAEPRKKDGYWTAPPFGGTSAAAPVIAGVCLLVQNLFQTLNPATGAPGKISATRMRNALTRPLNSSPGAPGAFIGVMPDLHKLIGNEFV